MVFPSSIGVACIPSEKQLYDVHREDDSRASTVPGAPSSSDVTSIWSGPDEHLFRAMCSNVPTLKFRGCIYYMEEGETLRLTIKRLGPAGGRCSARCRIVDGEGRCRPHSGEVHFAPGQMFAFFDVEAIKNDRFDTTFDFAVRLYDPQGCQLNAKESHARLKIIDINRFPTDRIEPEKLQDEDYRADNDWRLLCAYFRFNLNMCAHSKQKILSDQITNVCFIAKLGILVEVVNLLTDVNDDHDKTLLSKLSFWAILLLVPCILPKFLDFWECKYGCIGGKARKELQLRLLGHYLHLDEKIRTSMLPASFISHFNNNVHTVVADGYLNVLGIFASVGKIIMCLIYQVFLLAADKEAESSLNLYLLPAGTILILIIVMSLHRLQGGAMRQSSEEASDALTTLVDYVNCVIHNFRTVADYFARPLIAGKCKEKIRVYNAAAKQADVIHTTPRVFMGVTIAIIDSLWLIGGGMALARENPPLSLGGFLALSAALRSNGDEMQSLYSILLSMKRSIPAFWGIVQFLSLPTDLHKRKEAAAATSRYHDGCIRKNLDFDHFPLLLDHVTFGFKEDAPLVKRLSLQIEQGKLIQVSGQPGTGKKSFLELLSQVHSLTAGDGGVFVPEHLKVLNVCSETHILDGTLAYNLFFGVLVNRAHRAAKGIEDAEALVASLPEKDIERGKRICARLGLRQDMLDRMFDLGSDELATLSRTTRHLIHLARAFIYNPGVLVVHAPLALFDEELGRTITGALKEFVQCRGLELDSERSSHNSARTCIFSTCSQEDLIEADVKLTLRDGQLFLPGGEPCSDNHLAASAVSGAPPSCPAADALPTAPAARASSQERSGTGPAASARGLVRQEDFDVHDSSTDGEGDVLIGAARARTAPMAMLLGRAPMDGAHMRACSSLRAQWPRALLAGGGARGPLAVRFKGAVLKDVKAEMAADGAHAVDPIV